jgi:acylphosphatase
MAVKIIVSGRVQGVSFRNFIYENAVILGLVGYVKNLDVDKVEIVCEGDSEKIKELIKLARKGPRLSYVEKVSIEEISSENFNEFEIR